MIRTPLLALLLGLTAGAGSLPATEMTPYNARVFRDDTEVRCKPGQGPGVYVTNILQRDTPVQVLRELPDGWLEIKPPDGSFCWINTLKVKRIEHSPTNWVVDGLPDESVPVIVGSNLQRHVRLNVEGARLKRGTQVRGINPALDDRDGSWLPIEPPETEVRYIRIEAVSRVVPGQLAGTPGFHAAGTASHAPDLALPAQPAPAQLTTAEILCQRAQQAESRGQVNEAIQLYTHAASVCTSSQHELAVQALARANWLRQSTANPVPVHQPVQVATIPPATSDMRAQESSVFHTTGITAQTQAQPEPAAQVVWSGPGRLRRSGRVVAGRRTYALEAANGYPLYYVTPQQGLDLEPYLERWVDLNGPAIYSGELKTNYMIVSQLRLLQ
jgi:hypothetical protein